MNKISIESLIERYPVLEREKDHILESYQMMKDAFANKHKLLIAGNGGSAADAEHIVGELMKGFAKERKLSETFCQRLVSIDAEMGKELSKKLQGALPAVALSGHVALSTAYLNDVDAQLAFAQQVNGYGEAGDILLAISTSGNSKNVLYACVVAKAKGMKVIGLTGKDGGKLKNMADVVIVVSENETYKIQELHLPIYHWLCLALEDSFFEK